MKIYEVIGYTFNGACYCLKVECRSKITTAGTGLSPCCCSSDETDDYGMCTENCSGYGPHPVFAGDEEPGVCDECWDPLLECWECDDAGCPGCDGEEETPTCRYCQDDAYPGSDACGSCNQAIYDNDHPALGPGGGYGF